MSTYPVPRLFTFQEYLRIERSAKEKSEYVDGQMYSIAGASLRHDSIARNTLASLHASLRGSGCEVHTSDVKVAVSKSGPAFYPDVSVFCGEPKHVDSRTDTLLNPSLIVEVLSSSTASYDRKVKLPQYQGISSVSSILLISQEEIHVEHFSRGATGNWEHQILGALSDVMELAAPGCVTLPLADIYDGIHF